MKIKWLSVLVKYELADRKPIWMALSEFYLDIELEEPNFREFARIIHESPYSLDEVKTIDKYEVFPLFMWNLLSMAGEWAVFEEKWLVDVITRNLPKRYSIRRLGIEIQYLLFGWMNRDYYKQLEKVYIQEMKN